MSGIYLKGLEMPKDGELLCIQIMPSGKVSIALDLKCREIARALPVPDPWPMIEEECPNCGCKIHIDLSIRPADREGGE